MTRSNEKMSRALEKQLETMWLGLLGEISDRETLENVLRDVLTETERQTILKRIGIALYLDKGRSYEDIKNNVGASSATIASVAENLANEGWQDVIRRIKAEEWANDWTDKISAKIKRFFPA